MEEINWKKIDLNFDIIKYFIEFEFILKRLTFHIEEYT